MATEQHLAAREAERYLPFSPRGIKCSTCPPAPRRLSLWKVDGFFTSVLSAYACKVSITLGHFLSLLSS